MTESQEIGSCNYLAECGFKLLAAASHPTLGTPPGLELDEQFQRLSYLLYILLQMYTWGLYPDICIGRIHLGIHLRTTDCLEDGWLNWRDKKSF